MPKTSQAIALFLRETIASASGGTLGSEDLRLGVLDRVANLKVRDKWRSFLGRKIGLKEAEKMMDAAWDFGTVTNDEAVFILNLGLDRINFETTDGTRDSELTAEGEKARFALLKFALLNLQDVRPWHPRSERDAAVDANRRVTNAYLKGVVKATLPSGEASKEYLAVARQSAKNITSKAAVSDLALDASALTIKEVFLRQTDAIGGWSFLNNDRAHNVLVKPGINWGVNGYPTVTSWQSVYASTLGTLERGGKPGRDMKVTVADESGIENKGFGRTTLDDMEDTGIFGAAYFAGVENAFRRTGNADAHRAALAFVAGTLKKVGVVLPEKGKLEIEDLAPLIRRDHQAIIDRATSAGGVEVIPLDEGPTVLLKPVIAELRNGRFVRDAEDRYVSQNGKPLERHEVPMTRKDFESIKHFTYGLRVNAALLDITDIINLPKPPGRHGIMSNRACTGGPKNLIGILAGVDRQFLHSEWARMPPPLPGDDSADFNARAKAFAKFFGTGGVTRDDLEHFDLEASLPGDLEAKQSQMLEMAEVWSANLQSEAQRLAADTKGMEAGGQGQQLFEKIAELTLFMKHLMRFTYTDMRETMSSFGPDFGEKIFIGKSIASTHSAVVDVIATAALKTAYETTTDAGYKGEAELSELKGVDGLTGLPAKGLGLIRERLSASYHETSGDQWLRRGDPFALMGHAAMMRYGLAPASMRKVEMKMQPEGFRHANDHLGPNPPVPTSTSAKLVPGSK